MPPRDSTKAVYEAAGAGAGAVCEAGQQEGRRVLLPQRRRDWQRRRWRRCGMMWDDAPLAMLATGNRNLATVVETTADELVMPSLMENSHRPKKLNKKKKQFNRLAVNIALNTAQQNSTAYSDNLVSDTMSVMSGDSDNTLATTSPVVRASSAFSTMYMPYQDDDIVSGTRTSQHR